jgi:hypothetical protein
MHLAAKAPFRCRPVSSTLDSRARSSPERSSDIDAGAPKAISETAPVPSMQGPRTQPRLTTATRCQVPRSCTVSPPISLAHKGASRRRAAPGSQSKVRRSRREGNSVLSPTCSSPARIAESHDIGGACGGRMARSAQRLSAWPRSCTRWQCSTLRRQDCCLTLRSTGPPTACRTGREAVLVHHPPRGQCVTPPSAG